MAEGRQQHDWAIASSVLALLANCHRDPKKRAVTPDDFNPMRKGRGRQGTPLTGRNLDAVARAMGAKPTTVKASEQRVVRKKNDV